MSVEQPTGDLRYISPQMELIDQSYQDITYMVGMFEGYPIYETVTAEEQKEFVEAGYGTVSEMINCNISS